MMMEGIIRNKEKRALSPFPSRARLNSLPIPTRTPIESRGLFAFSFLSSPFSLFLSHTSGGARTSKDHRNPFHGIPNLNFPTRETGGSWSEPGSTPQRRTGRAGGREGAGGGRRRRRARNRIAAARRRPRAGPRAASGPATPLFPSRPGRTPPAAARSSLPRPAPRRPTPRLPSSVT